MGSRDEDESSKPVSDGDEDEEAITNDNERSREGKSDSLSA